ncbi:hypothetical protein [Paenibacillus ginsengarvi]|uniref:RCK N-terminal domain-containing protein n=1 Tax=Paenibacillus ginsengarvi TaxID=400777 RepID=A0A3B0C4K5_9BACL|nr:hypothetical protein [Paenibacillus ginsengarvi]RKN78246.1 hypothetical protein D7M11_23345 [Paenibacillus ginsengarvi]
MEKRQDIILVSAPNKAGERFIRGLQQIGQPVAGLANSIREQERLKELGVKTIAVVDTANENTWVIPDFPVGSVYLFESSLNLSCRYIRVCRSWTAKSIYVITGSGNPRLIYKVLGADYVVHTTTDKVSFLLESVLK